MWLGSGDDEIAECPKISGQVVALKSGKIRKQAQGGLFSDDVHEMDDGRGEWYSERPVHVVSFDAEKIQAPPKRYTDLFHPCLQTTGDITQELMGTQSWQ